jgi:probable F420-dependent oxidoreductase
VAVHPTGPIGAVFVSWDVADEPEVRRHLAGVPTIFHLHVAPAHRHRGVGRALLRRAEQRLRERGHSRVLLGVDRSNQVARDLYLWLGYRHPETPELRGLGEGEPYDILVADLNRPSPPWEASRPRLPTMDFGVGYFPTHDGIGPGDIARTVEERGQSAIFFAEHTHIPAARESPWAGGPNLPRKYWHTFDLFVALTAAAAATTRLRIGSGVCLVVERDPIITAKEVASIDRLSGGRFEFGVGAGWNREEMANHGTDPRTRMALLGERVRAMQAIWTQDEASFHGRFVDFDRIWSWPKPAQRPWPPVLVGGDGPTVLDRVLAYGDAWFPTWHPDTLPRITELRARAERPVAVQMLGVPPDPKVLEQLETAGVQRASTWLPSAPWSTVERNLEAWEQAIAELTGR